MHDTTSTVSHAGDAGPWTIETPGLALTLRRLDSGEIVLADLQVGSRDWLASPCPMFAVDGEIAPSTVLRDAEAVTKDDGTELRLTGALTPLDLTATVDITVHGPHPVVTLDAQLRNDTDADVVVGNLSLLPLRIAASDDTRLHVLAGGRWDEAVPPRGYRLETHDLDELGHLPHVASAQDGRSTGEYVPWLALGGGDAGLFAALSWSGRWRLSTMRDGGEAALSLGIAGFSHALAPGDEIALPSLILCGFEGDLDDGANTWRAWVADRWTLPVPDDWPWVQYNHWYAYAGDIDADRLLREATHAAAAGCEVFVIDDGWFMGRRPDSYHEGWGDWREDPSTFPHGLRAFGDQVRALGMRFGLWVEPERADPDGALVRSHPGFVATRDGQRIGRLTGGEGGVHLCLGNPEVQDWMAEDIIRVVQDYGVDWLKWDYNLGYGEGCNDPSHGHQAGDGHYAHTLGLYQVLDRIRAACPELMIENCASGGHRMDMGTLRHTHTNWLSDYTDRALSCRQHAQGAGLVLPLHHLNTWVLEDRDMSEYRSRMGGAFGVSSFLGRWSDAEREELRAAVAEYKRLRPLLSGSRYLLSGPLHQDWDIWQLVDRSRASFAILAFRGSGRIEEVRVRPRGLDPDRAYRLERSGGDPVDADGASLLTDGLAIALDPGGSEIIWGSMASG